jgi:hypothetical protein
MNSTFLNAVSNFPLQLLKARIYIKWEKRMLSCLKATFSVQYIGNTIITTIETEIKCTVHDLK